MNPREIRGIEIAGQGKIKKTAKGWIVPSQTWSHNYIVKMKGDKMSCNCSDCQLKGVKCKHQFAVEEFIQNQADRKTNKIKIVRQTYPQNWKAYNDAQSEEIRLFDILLSDLVSSIPDEQIKKKGRPVLSLNETLFCTIQKVYSQLSQRRAHSLHERASQYNQIKHAPHYNAVGKLLNQKRLIPILHQLLVTTAKPLNSVETCFAQDSSGFATTRYNEYYGQKYNVKRRQKWVRAHILVGTKTNIIVGAKITDDYDADSPEFRPLLTEAHENGFDIKEITADKAYSSRDNLEAAKKIGAIPYIPFKSSTVDKCRGSFYWSKMFHYFMTYRDEFMEHYHKRSNVESTFMMIKANFGERLKSKNDVAQKNELLCKLIAHNIVVLIHEIHELGIKAEFGNESDNSSLTEVRQ